MVVILVCLELLIWYIIGILWRIFKGFIDWVHDAMELLWCRLKFKIVQLWIYKRSFGAFSIVVDRLDYCYSLFQFSLLHLQDCNERCHVKLCSIGCHQQVFCSWFILCCGCKYICLFCHYVNRINRGISGN